MKFHVSRAMYVAAATALVSGLTWYASHGDPQYTTIAGAIAAALSAGILYNKGPDQQPSSSAPSS